MIIQNEKINVSIPKEWMSFYNTDTQNSTSYPTYHQTPYISGLGTNTVTISITPNNYTVDEKLSMYGWLYGINPFIPTYVNDTYVDVVYDFSNDVATFYGEPAFNYSADAYNFLYTSTNSSTGVVTKMYGGTLSTGSVRSFRIKNGKTIYQFGNPSIEFVGSMPTSGGITNLATNVYFTFSASASYSATIPNSVVVGANKNTKAYNFYLENTALKNELAAKADQYTTINLYHLDGTEWS